jgi:hypothetical protein
MVKLMHLLKMLKWVSLILIIAVLLITSCFEKPTFPVEPTISLNELYFTETGNDLQDSLIVIVDFEDGDGDLGLQSWETDPPYQRFDFVFNGDTIRIGDSDTLPPYNCLDYEIVAVDPNPNDTIDARVDTIYVQRNDNHFNYFLDFYVKEDGAWRLYDPAVERNCAPRYWGRYFYLNTQGDERPLEGELKYGIVSGFRLLFRNDSLRVRVRIQDRALHSSNIVETPPFMIQDRYRAK